MQRTMLAAVKATDERDSDDVTIKKISVYVRNLTPYKM